MDERITNAFAVIAKEGEGLRCRFHFDWLESVQQSVYCLRLLAGEERLPSLVAIVGGASSGKSTIFNNLLDGHRVSRTTARGHATKGPILAVHEKHRPTVERLLDAGRLFPHLDRFSIELDGDDAGSPDAVALLSHTVEALADVLLLDTPDFTSEAARQEGDVLLSLLPWSDQIVAVVDRERWFDRQSIAVLRGQSVRYGQRRMVVFNRTKESTLSAEDVWHGFPTREFADRQAERFGADEMLVLEFRRGRGLCVFPPGTFDQVLRFASGPRPKREAALLGFVSEAANRTLNQNEERSTRLERLGNDLSTALERALPAAWDCMTALMTPTEREHLEIVSRIFRVPETKAWLAAQKRRIERALRRVPVVGAVVGGASGQVDVTSEPADRQALGLSYFEAAVQKQAHEVQRVVAGSAFWDEIRKWTGLTPESRSFAWTAEQKDRVREDVAAFDAALVRWNARVEAECKGISPHMKGALGVGVLAIAVVLVAVPGPVAALTLASAQGAIGAALGKLAVATGGGALFGKHFGRLIEVAREKLIGSSEFSAVQKAAAAYRERIAETGRQMAEQALSEARQLVLPSDDPLAKALECLRQVPEAKA